MVVLAYLVVKKESSCVLVRERESEWTLDSGQDRAERERESELGSLLVKVRSWLMGILRSLSARSVGVREPSGATSVDRHSHSHTHAHTSLCSGHEGRGDCRLILNTEHTLLRSLRPSERAEQHTQREKIEKK